MNSLLGEKSQKPGKGGHGGGSESCFHAYFSNFPMGLWKTTLFWLPAWVWLSQGPLFSFWRSCLNGCVLAHPLGLLCFLGFPLWTSSCYCGAPKSPSWGRISVSPWRHLAVAALHSPSQGEPMGPAAALAAVGTLRTSMSTKDLLLAPAAPSLGPSLPFLYPSFQRACGRGSPREKPCRT